MTRILLAPLSLLLMAPLPVVAQGEPAGSHAELDALAWMDGRWRGPATQLTANGVVHLVQTERSGEMLGGRIRVVEGKGYNGDGTVGFNALGVIVRTAEGGYELRSWTLESAGTFPIVIDEAGYSWEVPNRVGKVHYVGRFDGETWTEVGSLVRDGQAPLEVFRMTLTKVDDGGWPAAGALDRE